jgi:propionyl-CoA carboxylase alpha chain
LEEERTGAGGFGADGSEGEAIDAAVAAAMWLQGANRAEARVLPDVPSGWRNARLPRQSVTFVAGETEVGVAYSARRDGAFDVSVDGGGDQLVLVNRWSPRSVDIEIDGRRRDVRVTRARDQLHVQSPSGTSTVDLLPRFTVPGVDAPAGGLTAPMPGVVVAVRVVAGDNVEVGQVMVVLEAMKMEHHIKAPVAGTVTEVTVAAGSQVENGAVLMVIDDAVAADPATADPAEGEQAP